MEGHDTKRIAVGRELAHMLVVFGEREHRFRGG